MVQGLEKNNSLQNGSLKLEKIESVVRFADGPPHILGQKGKYKDESSSTTMHFVDNNYDDKMSAGEGRKRPSLKSPRSKNNQQ